MSDNISRDSPTEKRLTFTPFPRKILFTLQKCTARLEDSKFEAMTPTRQPVLSAFLLYPSSP